MRLLVFLLLISLSFIGCESSDETPVQIISVTQDAPAAPPLDIPVGWTAHNLRVSSWVTTSTHIVAWVSYEINGTRTVSRLIRIPK